MSASGLIASITNFGLGTSAVKNIAEANIIGNEQKISTVVTIIRRLVWFTGLIGAFITAAISHWLSILSFGNSDYTWSFVWIATTLLINQLSSGQMVIIQGMRKLHYLAKANLYGAVVGLIITIPIYYKFKTDGIVPVIIITSIVTLFFSWYFSQKIKIKSVYVSKENNLAISKSMLRMGFLISLSGLLNVGTSYLLRIFISQLGTVADVGLYNAGFAIISTYVGLVFNAMGADYYPRLAAIANNRYLTNKTINQQADIALLILAPILLIFIVFINWAIILLYSDQFIPINTMIHWAALGIFFKAVTWAIGFLFLAKGASKVFFWSELTSNIYVLILNIGGYYFFGLVGLGISFFISYIIVFIQVFFIAKIKYQFVFQKSFIVLFSILFMFALLCFIIMQFVIQPYNYISSSVIIIISLIFSYNELDKRIGIKSFIKKFIVK